MNEVFIADPEMPKRLLETNPNAGMVTTFLEGNSRGYWDTSEENLDHLRQLYAEVDDKIEGTQPAPCLHAGSYVVG